MPALKGPRKGFALQGPDRRLQVTAAGWWYVGLTIALGVAALASGNNALLLLESLLLGGLILSGILSEWCVSAIEVRWSRRGVHAGEACGDEVVLINHSNFNWFAVEAGEWKEGRFLSHGGIERVEPRGTARLRSKRTYGERGVAHWEAFAVATAFPFGLARKIRFVHAAGQRLVWPARQGESPSHEEGHGPRRARHAVAAASQAHEIVEGELRPWSRELEFRDIVWTKRGPDGGLLGRVRRPARSRRRYALDLRQRAGDPFEAQLRALAAALGAERGEAVELELISAAGSQRMQGVIASLDALASAQASGQAPAAGGRRAA